jgi:hypothetical protein
MESNCHRATKIFLCRGEGGTESKLSSGKRLDCRERTSRSCFEVELHKPHIGVAINRLTEGLKSGACNNANLVTKDRYLDEARRLVGTKPIKVIGLSSINMPRRFG